MPFQSLTSYLGYNHVLGAAACFVHPGNGNVYGCACEQLSGARQNLSIYRRAPGAPSWELVKRYQGTVDSAGHITMGGAVIDQAGNLIVLTSLIIPGAPQVTTSGFQGCWIEVPGVDVPYTGVQQLAAHLADVEAVMHATQDVTVRLGWRIDAIETALGNLSASGLEAGDREALEWVKRVRALG